MAFDVSVERKRGKRRSKIVPAMNVTPLVDVVLVLLIIFMVITPMMVKQMQMFVPKRDDKAAEAKEDPGDEGPSSIVLSVRREGIFLNKERIRPTDLAARLENVFAQRTEKLLFFDADEDLPYGRAVEVLDLARGAGAKHIAVLTQPVKP